MEMEPSGYTAFVLAVVALVLSGLFALLGGLFAFGGGKAFIAIARLVVRVAKDFDNKADAVVVNKLSEEIQGNQTTIIDEIVKMRKRLVQLERIKKTADAPVDES